VAGMIRKTHKLGDWLSLCDRCQRVYYASQLREEWTGWMVCDRCWEPRHPQEFLRGNPENENVPWTRPDSNANTSVTTVDGASLVSDNYIDTNGDEDATLTVGTSNSVQKWGTALTADRTVTLSAAGAQHGNSFIIYLTEESDYNLIIGTVKTASLPSKTVVIYRNGAWELESYTLLTL